MDKPRGEGAWWRSAGQRRTWVSPAPGSTPARAGTAPTAGGIAPAAGDRGVNSLIDGVIGDTPAPQRTAVAAPPRPRQPIQWPPRPETDAPAPQGGLIQRARYSMRGTQENRSAGLRTRTRVVIVLALTAAIVVAAVVTTRALAVSTSTNFAGVLAAETPIELDFQSTGTLEQIYVTPGENVTAGQILATLDSTVQAQDVKSDELALASDEQRLAQLLGKSGQLAEQQAAQEYQKVQALASAQEQRGASTVDEENGILQADQSQEDAISNQLAADQAAYNTKCKGLGQPGCASLARDVSLDTAALSAAEGKVATVQAALDAAQSVDNTLTSLASTEQSLAEAQAQTVSPELAVDISDARDLVAQDLAKLVADKQALEDDTLVATAPGKVVSTAGERGELVGPSGADRGSPTSGSSVPGGSASGGPSTVSGQGLTTEPLITIDAAPGLEAIAQVPEVDITTLKIGQGATVTVDAISGSAFRAVVQSIVQVPVDVQGSVYYDVVLVPPAGSSWAGDLLPGMTASISVS